MEVSLGDLAASLVLLSATWLLYSSPALIALGFFAFRIRRRYLHPRFRIAFGLLAGIALAPMPPPHGIVPVAPPAALAFSAGWVHPPNLPWLAWSFPLSALLGLLLAWHLGARVPPNNSFKPKPLRGSA